MRDTASGVVGKVLARERNERFGERHARQGVGKRMKRAIQWVAGRAGRRQEKEMSDAASSAAGKTSARERNERFSERHDGQAVGKRKK
jgi:hypothetical protein